MANYAVTTWSTTGSYDAVLVAMHTKLETIDTTKVIRFIDMDKRGGDYLGLLIYDT